MKDELFFWHNENLKKPKTEIFCLRSTQLNTKHYKADGLVASSLYFGTCSFDRRVLTLAEAVAYVNSDRRRPQLKNTNNSNTSRLRS